MSVGLPQMLYSDGIKKAKQTEFKGYNHNLYAQDGELWDMKNLTSDLYPLLSPRLPRYIVETLTKPNGFYTKDGMYWVDGTGFYADGEKKGDVADSRKQFTSIGAYVIILPDKKWYNRLTGEFGDLEGQLERQRHHPGRHLRRGERGGQHHLRGGGQLGRHLQRGGRGGHIRGGEAPGEQPDHHHPGNRRGLPAVL